MTVEVRENFYYLMEASGIDPDLVLFDQHATWYEIQGALDGNQLNTSTQYANECRIYIVSGQNPNPALMYINELFVFQIQGTEASTVMLPMTGLYEIQGTPEADVMAPSTCIFQITDGPTV